MKFAEKFLSFKPKMEIYHILEDGDMVCVFFNVQWVQTAWKIKFLTFTK